MSASIAAAPAARSTFVTVLAWIFIGLSSFSVLISILQNLMVHLVFRGPEFEQAMQAAKETPQTPAFASFMFEYMGVFVRAVLLQSSSRSWRRSGCCAAALARLVVRDHGTGIAWNIADSLAVGMFPSMSEMPGGAPEEFQSHFQTVFIVMMVFGGLMALAFSALFGWIIKRLLSPQIAGEFVSLPFGRDG